MSKCETEIITGESLNAYFYKALSEINKKSLCPVPEEIIFYSSEVLNKYSLSENFFEVKDGRVKEKILGYRLLEVAGLGPEEKKREYKDIADSALIVTGYFSKSIDPKLFDSNYYIQIGKSAYERMNTFAPSLYNVPSFYKVMSTCFETLVKMMTVFSQQDDQSFSSGTDLDLLVRGITPLHQDKVS